MQPGARPNIRPWLIIELSEAIDGSSAREHSRLHAAQVIVATGGKQILCNALMATLNAVREVFIPAHMGSIPKWCALRRTPVRSDAVENQFKLHRPIEGRARRNQWFIFNRSNTTGAAYTHD